MMLSGRMTKIFLLFLVTLLAVIHRGSTANVNRTENGAIRFTEADQDDSEAIREKIRTEQEDFKRLKEMMFKNKASSTSTTKTSSATETTTKVETTEPTETSSKSAEPETLSKATEPETSSKASEVDSSSQATEPETSSKASEPETSSKASEVDSSSQATELETSSKASEPEASSKVSEPDNSSKASEVEALSESSEPEISSEEPKKTATEAETSTPTDRPIVLCHAVADNGTAVNCTVDDRFIINAPLICKAPKVPVGDHCRNVFVS